MVVLVVLEVHINWIDVRWKRSPLRWWRWWWWWWLSGYPATPRWSPCSVSSLESLLSRQGFQSDRKHGGKLFSSDQSSQSVSLLLNFQLSQHFQLQRQPSSYLNVERVICVSLSSITDIWNIYYIDHPETKRLNIDIQQLIKLSIVMTAIKNTRMPKFNLKSSFWLEGEPSWTIRPTKFWKWKPNFIMSKKISWLLPLSLVSSPRIKELNKVKHSAPAFHPRPRGGSSRLGYLGSNPGWL